MCRRQHGAAFGTYAGYLKDQFRLTSGAEALKTYHSSPGIERQFCGRCGSTLFWVDSNGHRIWVTLGTLDGDPGRPADCHIFVGSKAPWYTISVGLPQYDTWPER